MAGAGLAAPPPAQLPGRHPRRALSERCARVRGTRALPHGACTRDETGDAGGPSIGKLQSAALRWRMVSVSRRTVLAAMPAIALPGRGVAADPAKLRIGTGAEGAAFLLYGTALVDGLKSTGFGLDIANKPTR